MPKSPSPLAPPVSWAAPASPLRVACGLVAFGALAGCLGSVGEGPRAAAAPADGVPAPGPTAGAPSPGNRCLAGARALAAPWRATVLTREQYINTVSDLLGFDVRPLVTFDDLGGRRFVPGVSLSALGIEERMTAAEAIAVEAARPQRWPGFIAADPAQGEDAAAAAFVDEFGARAFRRPLSSEARAGLRRLFDGGRADGGGFGGGVEWVVAGVLQAPDFLYQLSPAPGTARPGSAVALDPSTLASRLAFFLWNSGPDAELLASARRGDLATPAAIAARVSRMLSDPRARRMREDYYTEWLKLGQLATVQRAPREFNPGLGADLVRSLLDGVHDLYTQGGGKAAALWGTPTLFVNDGLAALYGLPPPASPAAMKAVAAPPDQRRGLLTHPAVLSVLAQPDASDPVARGVFIEEEVLCQTLPDPAADIPELPPLRAGLSTRQRMEEHRRNPACAACHQLFEPFGLALESYDAIGRYRTTDQGVPVDSSGEIRAGLDLDGAFAGGMQLLDKLAASAAVRDCLLRKTFEYALRRELSEADACAVESIEGRFRDSGDLVDLLARVATSDTFQTVLIEE